MTQQPPIKIPINWLLLDGVGAVLFALGAAEHFADINLLPASVNFEYRGVVMMMVGVLLMLPFVLAMLNQVRARAETKVIK
jgi:hypothetical protein